MGANGHRAEIPVEDYICLALYSASRAVTGVYRELLDELHLTYPQYLVMRVLWQRGTVPIKDIAETLQLDYGTLSPSSSAWNRPGSSAVSAGPTTSDRSRSRSATPVTRCATARPTSRCASRARSGSTSLPRRSSRTRSSA